MLYYLLLFGIAILPVIILMVYIYHQDKYQKEPIKTLAKAFIGGMIAIALDILIVTGIQYLAGDSAITKTVFFSAFLEAGIPEEFSKFLIFMLFIWRDKNFDEYFDGIVYATFIGLGFACVENIEYVFMFGFGTGVVSLGAGLGSILYFVFLWGDFKLWKLGLKYINKQQANSRRQAQEAALQDVEKQIHSGLNYDSEYRKIDWNAGDKW